MSKKVSKFKAIAESLVLKKGKNIPYPTPNLSSRKMSIDEIKKIVLEEFGKVKDVEDEKVKEGDWSDAEVENEVDWMKKLGIKEFFDMKEACDEEDEEEDK